MKTINVVAAVIVDGDRVFATQRGYGAYKDWWEFPGGKIEEGESPQEALKREIREELQSEIIVGKYLGTVDYDYPEFHLRMLCFMCEFVSGELTLLEHEAAKWVTKNTIDNIEWLPADLIIIDNVKHSMGWE